MTGRSSMPVLLPEYGPDKEYLLLLLLVLLKQVLLLSYIIGKKEVKTAHRQKVSPKPTQLPPIRLPGVRTFGQGQLAQRERGKPLKAYS